MTTINTIIKELKNVPIDKLEEIYSHIKSLSVNKLDTEARRKKILSFSGAFSDMSEDDYKEFQLQTEETRKNLFDRHIEL